jgi:CubicO group peptidase (beta-lactamase class C family)
MLHQAGLKEFIPFHQSLDTGLISPKEYSKYQLPVAKNMFADSAIYSWIRAKITSTALYTVGKSKFPEYKYSDLGYYFLREIAEKQTKRKWEDFLNEEFYSPMNLTQLGYNPRNWSDTLLIAPTERDTEFRKQLVYGYVHDQGAALMGGVAGHAGLFSNAYDLANVMFLLCEHGKFGNHQFIQSKTVDMFNYRHHKGNRRGLIFDKPSLDHVGGSASPLASESSFGHTGFTGTMCWADPENDIIFIFLSNRIHPSAENKKLLNLSIRTKMHTEVYQQILGTH